MPFQKRVLVTGATEKQGLAVIDALLASPMTPAFNIFAVTPDSRSPAARALLRKSSTITLIEGNLDDCGAIFRKMPHPIWGVFLIQNCSASSVETRQGNAMIDASIQNGVVHFIYSSVDRGGPKSDLGNPKIPQFVAKHQIESYLKEISIGTGMSWTVLRSTAFFDNLNPDMDGKVFAKAWSTMGTKKLQFVSAKDVGKFAAMSFHRPGKFMNEAISLAGDELTQQQANLVFKKALGRKLPMTFDMWKTMVFMSAREKGLLFRWFENEGFGADVQECRRINPQMEDLRKWLINSSTWSTECT